MTSTEESLSGESRKAMAARIGLNDNKAGMQGLDKEKINKIILEASKGSKFYENELKKDKVILKKVEALKSALAEASESQLRTCLNKADAVLDSLYLQYDFSRTIVHMDMDAFYAAVEMRDDPSLANVPMAVGGADMLSTSNYLARRYGVRAAMPGFIARKLCPKLVIVPGNMAKYSAVSLVIRGILSQYDPNMTPLSLDEAYMDFTDHLTKRAELSESSRTFPEFSETMCRCEPVERSVVQPDTVDDTVQSEKTNEEETREDYSRTTTSTTTAVDCSETSTKCGRCRLSHNPRHILFGVDVEESVREMRHRIHLKTRLTASAGIAANCLLSKICSDKNKPNGQYMLPFTVPAVQEFMRDLPVRKVPGVGKVSEKQLLAFDINTCQDFYRRRDVLYFLYSGGMFEYFMSVYMGLGSNRLSRNEEGPKSKSVERTFRGMSNPTALQKMCHELSMELSEDLKAANDLKGKTVTLKIKLVTFELKTRSRSLADVTNKGEDIYKVANSLLLTEMKNCVAKPLSLRLMGVRMSNFTSCDSKQQKLKVARVSTNSTNSKSPTFFDTIEQENKAKKLNKAANRNEPLGLLAYMTDCTAVEGREEPPIAVERPPRGLDRFSVKRKNVWDGVDDDPPSKSGKGGSRGQVTVCDLLDSDSTTDPWTILEKSASRRTAHEQTEPSVKRNKYGPLDFYRSHDDDVPSPWSLIDSESSGRDSAGPPRATTRPVESYFTKTRSVWEDLDCSSDDDVVCISGSPLCNSTLRKVPCKQSKSASGTKSKSTAVSQPLLTLFNVASERRSGHNKRSSGARSRSERTECEVITIDSD